MNNIFGTNAFSTMAALLAAYRAGKNSINSEDYPFLPAAFYGKASNYSKSATYFGIHFDLSRTTKVIGYNVRTDLDGNMISKKPVKKNVIIYTFDPNKVEEMITRMINNGEVENMLENVDLMKRLAEMIRGV